MGFAYPPFTMNEIEISDAGPNVTIATPEGSSMEGGETVSVAPPPGASSTISQENSLANYIGSDYKPAKERAAKIQKLMDERLNEPTAEGSIVYGDDHVHVEITDDRDYLTPEETTKKSELREGMIMEVAKRIYKSYSTRNKRYKQAQALLKDATEAAMESPGKELDKALKCIERGKPMTKKKAIEQARYQILTQTQTK